MEGQVSGNLPRPARKKPRDEWAQKAESVKQEHPGEAVRVGTEIPRSTYVGLKSRAYPPFRGDDGDIQINMRNSYVDEESGIRYGDIYFTYVEHKRKRTNKKAGS